MRRDADADMAFVDGFLMGARVSQLDGARPRVVFALGSSFGINYVTSRHFVNHLSSNNESNEEFVVLSSPAFPLALCLVGGHT